MSYKDPIHIRGVFESFSENEATTQELVDESALDLEGVLKTLAHLAHHDEVTLVNHENGDFWRYDG